MRLRFFRVPSLHSICRNGLREKVGCLYDLVPFDMLEFVVPIMRLIHLALAEVCKVCCTCTSCVCLLCCVDVSVTVASKEYRQRYTLAQQLQASTSELFGPKKKSV